MKNIQNLILNEISFSLQVNSSICLKTLRKVVINIIIVLCNTVWACSSVD